MWRGPWTQVGAAGPWMRSLVTTPAPTVAVIRAMSWRWRRRSWVAQAVELARTNNSPSRSDTGSEGSAISGPTSCVHRANTTPDETRSVPPRWAMRRDARRPTNCGCRSSGRGPDQPRRRRVSARWPVASFRAGALRRAARADSRAARAISEPLECPGGVWDGLPDSPNIDLSTLSTGLSPAEEDSSGMVDPPVLDVEPVALEFSGYIGGCRPGGEHLLIVVRRPRHPRPAPAGAV